MPPIQSKIKKWGNNLALRIPKLIASNINLKMNEKVILSIKKDSIIITPIGRQKYSLEKLLEGVTQKNLHGSMILLFVWSDINK